MQISFQMALEISPLDLGVFPIMNQTSYFATRLIVYRAWPIFMFFFPIKVNQIIISLVWMIPY
jgi:hypothetical protein